LNIAIFTPTQNPYSETFIQAHKNYLKEKVFYYYGSGNAIRLEGHSSKVSYLKLLGLKINRKIFKKPYSSISERILLDSLKANKIDVVLAEFGIHAQQILPVIKKTGLPLVVHFHGYDASVDSVIQQNKEYKEVFAYASKVIGVSKVMMEKLKLLGCPEDKLIYNVYGPQPEFHLVKPTFAKKQFVAIGRFTNKKAPYYTLLAFAEAVKQHPESRLILAGDGYLLNTCKNLARHLGIENQVSFPGVISPVAYRELLTDSLAFVQHSITAENGDMEGTPLAILEASAAGLPVISTKHAGIPDVIVDGKTGLLSDEHDVQAMAANMVKLIQDIDYAMLLGAAGRQNIKQHFSLERHIASLQDILQSIK